MLLGNKHFTEIWNLTHRLASFLKLTVTTLRTMMILVILILRWRSSARSPDLTPTKKGPLAMCQYRSCSPGTGPSPPALEPPATPLSQISLSEQLYFKHIDNDSNDNNDNNNHDNSNNCNLQYSTTMSDIFLYLKKMTRSSRTPQ